MADAEIANGEIDALLPDEGVEQITPQTIADAVKLGTAFTKVATDALDDRVDDEATARGQADTALGGRIDTEKGRLDNLTAADVAYGDGTVADTLNAEPTLHDDAVSTATFNETTGTQTQGLIDGKVDSDGADYTGLKEQSLANRTDILHLQGDVALKANTADLRTDGAVRALAEAQITEENLPGGKIADAIETAVNNIEIPTPRTNEEIDGRADARIAASPAVQANTAKVGTTATERQNIASIPTLASSVSNNNAKPTTTQVDAQADARIVEQIKTGGTIANAITEAGGGGGAEGALVLEDLALETGGSCQVQGADTIPSNFGTVGLAISLTCIGNAPNTGNGELDGVITLRSDTNFTWNGVARSFIENPLNLVATRAPNDGANDAMVQRWIVKGAVFDFTKNGSIFINKAIGATNITGSFEGTVNFGEPAGQAVAPVEAIVAKARPPLSPSVLQSHADTKPAQRPMTSFVATHANSPLSTTPFVITTSDLAGIADGEVIKVEFPFFFGAQSFSGFAPDCGLAITQDGNPIKTYDAENDTGLIPQGTNQISFFAVKGGDITVQPIVKLNTTPDFEGDTSLDITFFPYTGGFDFFQLGVLHDEAVRLIQAQIAIESAKQALINNRVEGAVNGLQNILNVLQASFQAMQTRLENPAYAVLDRAVVEAAEVGETIARTDRGIAFNAVLEEGGNPWQPVIVFDLVSGAVSPSSSSAINFAEVRDDNGVWVNVLSPEKPARTEAGVVRSGNAIVDADNPLRINLGLGGHHQDSTITLTPDPDNLPVAGAIFNVDFHAVVGGNNRAFFEMDIAWGGGAIQTQTATSENGETVSVEAQQIGNTVRVRIVETGAESLPIAGGYLSLWAHYDITIPLVPAGADWQRIGDHNGHFVMLLETGAGASSQSRPVVIHYGNGQKIATNRPASYIEFYTNNDTNIGNIYSVDLAESYDLTPLQASAEAGDDTLGFFAAPVFHHTSEVVWDTGHVFTDKKEVKRNILDELDVLNEAKDAGAGLKLRRVVLTGDGVAPASLPDGATFGGRIGSGIIDDTRIDSNTKEYVGYGARVIVPCANGDVLVFSLNGVSNEVSLNFAATEGNSVYRTGGYLLDSASTNITFLSGSPSGDCQVEFFIAYRDFNPLNL